MVKQKRLIIISVGVTGIVLLGFIAASVGSRQPAIVVQLPTDALNKKTGVENTVTDAKNATLPNSASVPQQPHIENVIFASQSTNSNILPTQPRPTNLINSPKQSEVRQSVTKEFIYYPLLTANDPAYSTNWAIQQVNAPAAWNITTGNATTVVAVIDTGFALDHEELTDRWAINTQEIGMTNLADFCWSGVTTNKQTNGCDDDNNGYVDDWRGWNFTLGDNNAMTGRINPNGGGVSHGTEVAGLAGSTGNNNIGTTTISWNTRVMPLQAMSDDGPGYTSDIAAAIYYAVDNGADVINLSLGGYDFDISLKTATDYAYAHNVVVVAAAGNCGITGDPNCSTVPAGSMLYPALNDHVVSVGATTSTSGRANFSSYGPALDVVAPGSGTIVSPTWMPGNTTSLYVGSMYGTSFASPQVASLVALIKSIRPDSSPDDITALLLATTAKPSGMNGALYTNEFGHGIINSQAALTVAQSLNSTIASPILNQVGGVLSEHSFRSTDIIGSGCKTNVLIYCAVWFRDSNLGRDRYLPYKLTDGSGQTGWTWPGSYLANGNWQTRAITGDYISPIPYFLLNK